MTFIHGHVKIYAFFFGRRQITNWMAYFYGWHRVWIVFMIFISGFIHQNFIFMLYGKKEWTCLIGRRFAFVPLFLTIQIFPYCLLIFYIKWFLVQFKIYDHFYVILFQMYTGFNSIQLNHIYDCDIFYMNLIKIVYLYLDFTPVIMTRLNILTSRK